MRALSAPDLSHPAPVAALDLVGLLQQTDRNPLSVMAKPGLAAKLSTAWPDIAFSTSQGSFKAIEASRPALAGNALQFSDGLLNPGSAAGLWLSSTIAAVWHGAVRTPGLADRLQQQTGFSLHRQRGHAIAQRLVEACGQLPAPGLAAAQADIARGATLFVASGHRKADLRQLAGLLNRRDAPRLVALAGQRDRRFLQACQAAGVPVLPPAALSWPLLLSVAEIHGSPSHPAILMAGILGKPRFANGERLVNDPAALAAAHLVLGTRYLDPQRRQLISCEALLDHWLEWQRLRARMPVIASFAGISFWKRRRMAEFVGGNPRFTRSARAAISHAARAGGAVAVWPSRAPSGIQAAADAAGVALFRVEDGFIRSRGLGADFIPPASVVIDRRGIYYDPRQPSDLELLLQQHDFPPALLDRARRLIDSLVAQHITKYNLGGDKLPGPLPDCQRRILVPGQVEDDLSVRTGAAGIAPGLDLLREVRHRNPGAYILYKPHPDVEAGHRPGAVPDAAALRWADRVVRGVAMQHLIGAVDEVHTVTSLVGFEALLRGRTVVTYGHPFYAGWQLTTDLFPMQRRNRPLTLEQLVAGTLILYPHYLDPLTLLPCGPEQLIDQLARPARWLTPRTSSFQPIAHANAVANGHPALLVLQFGPPVSAHRGPRRKRARSVDVKARPSEQPRPRAAEPIGRSMSATNH